MGTLLIALTVSSAASADPPPSSIDCRATPAQCVSKISYADPSAVTAAQSADGTVTGGWDPDQIASVEELPAPLPVAEAAAVAASRAAAHGLDIQRLTRQPAASMSRAKAHASQWSNDCSYTIYSVWLVWLDGYNAHAHAKSQQYCSSQIDTHGVTHWITRDSTNYPGDSDANLGGGWAIAESFANCHSAGDHWWYNYTSLWANPNGSGVVQGPAGYFNPSIKRFY
jgi:hypothetical protein